MKPLKHATTSLPHSASILRLSVRNHAGVMSHICGLFARRAFNLDGILCLPQADATRSTMLLAVSADGRLEQIVRQLRKLEDVVEVEHAEWGWDAFAAATRVLAPPRLTHSNRAESVATD